MTRLEALLKIGLIGLVILGALIWALWTRSEFEVRSLGIDFCVQVDEGECETATEGVWEGKVKHGEHTVVVSREGWLDWISKVEVGRWGRIVLEPVWRWAPILSFENWENWWRVPEEVKGENFQDDQWEVLSEMCGSENERPEEAVLLNGLPDNVLELKWAPEGNWAVGEFGGILGGRWFVYDALKGESKKMDSRVKEMVPLKQNKFVYLWVENGEGEMAVSNWQTGEFQQVTELSGVTAAQFWVNGDESEVLIKNESEGNNQDFYVIKMEDGRRDKITSGNDAEFGKWSRDGKQILLWQKNEDGSLRMGIWNEEMGEKIELGLITDPIKVTWNFAGDGFWWISEEGILNEWEEENTEVAELGIEGEGILAECATEKEIWLWKGEGEVLRVRFEE